MSEAITVSGATTPVTIYGTLAGDIDYIRSRFGKSYTKWLAASADVQKQTFISAMDLLESQGWDPTVAPDLATRDGLIPSGQTAPVFPKALCELAVLIFADSTLPQNQDQGTNVRAVGAGSARVEFFVPTSAAFGTAPVLPPIIMRLVGQYLASSTISTGGAPEGQSAGCESPFSSDAGYKRWWPY